jgi:hypothetical protein
MEIKVSVERLKILPSFAAILRDICRLPDSISETWLCLIPSFSALPRTALLSAIIAESGGKAL